MRRTSLDCVYQLACRDDRVIFIGSDLGVGVLADMKKDMPERWIMEGVSEQHIIGMAAGLSMEGYIPYVNTIASFLTRRCFEQLAIDLSLMNLPVRLIANGGGVVYAPLGPTHQAIEDIAILRTLPNMTIIAPCDAAEMRRVMDQTLDWDGPIYIRLAKGGDPIISSDDHNFSIGKGILLREVGEVLVISTGVMTQCALAAADMLQHQGIATGVLHCHTVKPLDQEFILELASKVRLVVTLEEHIVTGGLGTAVLETLHRNSIDSLPQVECFGIPDQFIDEYGSQQSIWQSLGLTPQDISQTIKERLG